MRSLICAPSLPFIPIPIALRANRMGASATDARVIAAIAAHRLNRTDATRLCREATEGTGTDASDDPMRRMLLRMARERFHSAGGE